MSGLIYAQAKSNDCKAGHALGQLKLIVGQQLPQSFLYPHSRSTSITRGDGICRALEETKEDE